MTNEQIKFFHSEWTFWTHLVNGWCKLGPEHPGYEHRLNSDHIETTYGHICDPQEIEEYKKDIMKAKPLHVVLREGFKCRHCGATPTKREKMIMWLLML
jgi:hypothetical protein